MRDFVRRFDLARVLGLARWNVHVGDRIVVRRRS
jgi:hypothetical protein